VADLMSWWALRLSPNRSIMERPLAGLMRAGEELPRFPLPRDDSSRHRKPGPPDGSG
jgi:hypothetical protein